MKIIVGLFFSIFFQISCFSIDLKIVSKYRFTKSGMDYLLISPASFVATNYQTVIIADAKDANLKVYRKGKMVQVYGTRGIGPGEFIMPIKLGTSGHRLVVYDFKAKRLTWLELTLL